MFITLTCISLRIVRHSDRHSILSAYTRQRGRMSFLIPAGNGREAARRRAMLMPGSRFTCVADIRDNSDRLPTMRDVMPRGVNALNCDPVKSAVTLFLADFLNTLMRDAMPDELLFEYCDTMLEFYASNTRGTANFHLLFMIGMMHFAGIEPDMSTYRPGYLFDMVDGVFRDSAPLHGRFLERDEATAAATLMRMTSRNLDRWKLTAHQRNTILDRLIEYYTLHFTTLQSMRSLDILRSLFH
ncbi:MAG: DNA repair protein RecO [Muribaculaceae bacterium]|nr:DNA repair protein RecO [Muribaculaceae bacterium]